MLPPFVPYSVEIESLAAIFICSYVWMDRPISYPYSRYWMRNSPVIFLVWDYTSKYVIAGLREWSVVRPGHYDGCLQLKHHEFSGQHCSISIEVRILNRGRAHRTNFLVSFRLKSYLILSPFTFLYLLVTFPHFIVEDLADDDIALGRHLVWS